jgi:membrane dipeptidase
MRRIALALLPLLVAGALHAQSNDAAVRLAQDAVIVDTHIDAPEQLIQEWNDLGGSVPQREFDYPRAKAGGLDVAFMSIYTSAAEDDAGKAWTIANLQIDAVQSLAARHPDKFALLRSPKDVDALRANGRVLLPLGMENAAPIGDDLAKLQFFFDRGVRYITLAHGANNRLSDSSYADTGKWGGLSPFGEQVVKEMNRLGIMVDVSHLSDDAVRDILALTDVPVVATHSGLRHFTPGFARNIDDALAKAIAKEGGVVQLTFGTIFLDAKQARESAERRVHVAAMEHEGKSQAEIDAYEKTWAEAHPPPVLHVDAVLDQVDHAVKVMGIDHVGVGSDFDGVDGELPVELKSVADYPALVAGLQQRGYKDADIRKILGGNLLRVWREVEAKAAARR